jgi:hypothetical protein
LTSCEPGTEIPPDRLMLVDMRILLNVLSVVALCFTFPACHRASDGKSTLSPIVGTWFVKAPEAPFPYHMFVFNRDGTMQQANPDAGDPNTSDSNGLGVWVPDGDRIKGKFVEVTGDRATHQFVSRGEISFLIKVTGNEFSGTASAIFYDARGQQLKGPLTATLAGQRVMP